MDTLHHHLYVGKRLNEDLVALESLVSAVRKHPTAITSKTNTLLNIATESFAQRWDIPRVLIATESFQSTARAQASVVACESIVELAKAAWRKFVEWLKGLVNKIKAMFSRGEARGKTLSQQALELEKMLAKSGDLPSRDLEGNWSKLTMDGEIGYKKPVAFLLPLLRDIDSFTTRTSEYIKASMAGKSATFDVPWQGPRSMRNHKIEGMNKPQLIAMPNNTILVIGNRNHKPVVEVKVEDPVKGTIKSADLSTIDKCLSAIGVGIGFLERRTSTFKEFVTMIDNLTKTETIPFDEKLSEDEIREYTANVRAGVLAGANFIQHIERFVEAATSGLLEYCYASFKTSSKKNKEYERTDGKSVTSAFTDAIKQNNLKGLRIMMKDSLIVDPSFEQIDKMAMLTKDIEGLYVPHDGAILEEDSSKWDEAYMNKQMVRIVGNFSHERFNHLKKVVRKLYPIGYKKESKKNNEAVAVPNAFREAVENGNVIGIRIMLKDSLLVDRSFKSFDEMDSFASQYINIYDKHDGRELIHEESLWDDNYMNKLMVQVVRNFSRERVDLLKKVVRKLRPANK